MTNFMKCTGSLTPDCQTIIDHSTHLSAKSISDPSTIEVPNNHDHNEGRGVKQSFDHVTSLSTHWVPNNHDHDTWVGGGTIE